MNLAVIGSGGREHAICYKLKQSKRIKKLICVPGNAGTQKIAKNIEADISNFDDLYQIIKKNNIDVVIIGPEQPLVDGLVDYLTKKKVKVFDIVVNSGQILQFVGGSNISTAGSEPDTITIDLGQNLTNIESISSATSNANLTLASNGTGDVVINDTLTFSAAASTPSASAVTKIYNKTAGGGGTGLFFINSNISSGTEGELISKKKATALAIALG